MKVKRYHFKDTGYFDMTKKGIRLRQYEKEFQRNMETKWKKLLELRKSKNPPTLSPSPSTDLNLTDVQITLRELAKIDKEHHHLKSCLDSTVTCISNSSVNGKDHLSFVVKDINLSLIHI